MANCIKCGAELMPGAVYCHACGKKQVAEKRKGRSRPNGAGNAYKRGKTWTARAAGYSTQRRKRTVAIGSFANGPQRAASRQKQKP